MAAIGAFSNSLILSSFSKCVTCHPNPRICFLVKSLKNSELAVSIEPYFSTFSGIRISVQKYTNFQIHTHFSVKASAAAACSSSEYTEEPATKVKFQSSLVLPGCSTSLSLLGTGYREKVFAIIGVKVYAAGVYVNQSVFTKLDPWKGHSSADLKQDSALFDTIFQAPLEKSLHIVLVRDVDGKTFWDALGEAISPRIKLPTAIDESALSIFRSIFQGRPLNKGTSIFLTWLDPTKMLVSVSSEVTASTVDATIESLNVTSALFDVFLGSDPVSPTLKSSVADGLAAVLE